MRIGLLKEVKSSEQRVLLTPAAVQKLYNTGNEILVEKDLIKNLITNFIDNAMKVSKEGSNIYLNVYLNDELKTVLEVKDEGIGISE